MYGYSEIINISPDQILQKITQQQIFEFIMKVRFDFNNRYISPFRNDKNPNCRFEQREDGTILFIDFGESGHTHRNCFTMVMDKYSETLNGCIMILCHEFKLSTNTNDYEVTDSLNRPVYQYDKRDSVPAELKYDRKIADKSDILFWSQYLISISDIESDNVFCCNRFSIRNNKGYRIITPYRHCYVMDFIDKIKIYQPYGGKYKWISNCDEDTIGNFDNLPKTGRELIIQKSYKDFKVMNLLGYNNVIWLHNEGCIPSIAILNNLSSRFEYITIFYDNDDSGIAASKKLSDVFNIIRPSCSRVVSIPKINKHMEFHNHYLKNTSDFISKEGRQELIKILNYILYGKNT